MRRLALLAGFSVVLGGVLAWHVGPVVELLWRVPFGWVAYLARVLPNVTIAWGGVATALLCLALFTAGLHRTLAWFSEEVQRARGVPIEAQRRWSFRWTASLVTLIVVMFAAGISATGVVHQAGWLIASRQSLGAPGTHPASRWGRSVHHLAEIGEAIPVVLDPAQFRHELAPPREAPQSWMTEILPYVGFTLGGALHRDLTWNDPRNSALFKGVVPIYLNPQIGLYRDPEGYALSHYAGNVHVLGRGRHSSRPATAEAANTIFAGEVAEGFQPWGDPANLRDPALGVNRVPGGFGGPSGTGANFLFVDGSVRFLSHTTSPEVLRRLGSQTTKGPSTDFAH